MWDVEAFDLQGGVNRVADRSLVDLLQKYCSSPVQPLAIIVFH